MDGWLGWYAVTRTEIAEALLRLALERGATQVRAHTTDDNVASTRVLLRSGFTRTGPGPEPGSVEYRATSPADHRPTPATGAG